MAEVEKDSRLLERVRALEVRVFGRAEEDGATGRRRRDDDDATNAYRNCEEDVEEKVLGKNCEDALRDVVQRFVGDEDYFFHWRKRENDHCFREDGEILRKALEDLTSNLASGKDRIRKNRGAALRSYFKREKEARDQREFAFVGPETALPKAKKAPKTKKVNSAERIYSLYPRKVGRGGRYGALNAISTAIKKVGAEFLEERTRRFAEVHGEADDFTPYPSTWFNQERFNDDESTWRKRGTSRAKPGGNPRNFGIEVPTGEEIEAIAARRQARALREARGEHRASM